LLAVAVVDAATTIRQVVAVVLVVIEQLQVFQ